MTNDDMMFVNLIKTYRLKQTNIGGSKGELDHQQVIREKIAEIWKQELTLDL